MCRLNAGCATHAIPSGWKPAVRGRCLGLTRFDGHPRSGTERSREDVQHHGEHGYERPRPRRSFTVEFKAEIVELCQRGDRTIGQVSKDFDLTETAVREWVRRAELDVGTRSDGLTSDERAELAQVRVSHHGCRFRPRA
ncbi:MULTISPECIES: transposase [Micromonospora]|uniref:Transposase n=2 Tax=Micromonospora sicca TaxID=2202420 RepID=A0ABU5JEG8_9ACTN|nr:transposase [Micromonospora sp. 4G53]MDZ5490981.1 transposase [Micromonospora sp. 4G53]